MVRNVERDGTDKSLIGLGTKSTRNLILFVSVLISIFYELVHGVTVKVEIFRSSRVNL